MTAGGGCGGGDLKHELSLVEASDRESGSRATERAIIIILVYKIIMKERMLQQDGSAHYVLLCLTHQLRLKCGSADGVLLIFSL